MSGTEPTPAGSYGEGVLAVAIGTFLFHPAVVVVYYLLGQAGLVEDQAGWAPVLLAANPVVTELLWVPLAAVVLRKRERSLVAMFVGAGIMFLLNGACWGVVTLAG